MAIDVSNNLWVADYTNNRLQKLNSSGVYQSKITLTGPGHFNGIGGLARDSGGNLWVTDARGDGPEP